MAGRDTLDTTPLWEYEVVSDVLDDVDDSLLGIKVWGCLAVITKADGRADVKAPAVGCYFSEEHTKEGGLPDTILSDDPDLVVSGEDVVEVL